MRRSQRLKHVPERHSPTSEDAIIAKKEALLRRYLALNMKALNALKPIRRGTPCPPPPLEMSPSCSSIPGQSYNYFAKFGKPEDPEIFGVPPEKGSGADVAKPQAQKIHVTGDSEPCNEWAHGTKKEPLEANEAPDPSKSTMASVLANRSGLPDMGFADLVSQAAAVPRAAFPANSNEHIEASAHPCNSRMNRLLTPQKKKLIQQHLILLLHAYKCQRLQVTKLPCPVPFCEVMKKVQAHMKACHDGYTCIAPFCSSSRRIMCHWKHCKVLDCIVCSRLRTLLLTKKKQIDTEKKEKMLFKKLHIQPPQNHAPLAKIPQAVLPSLAIKKHVHL